MQKKRNIKLILVLIVLILSAISAYFITRPADKLKVSRDIFSYEDPSSIDKVVFTDVSGEHQLTFEGSQWKIGREYKADPQRVSVLFAILKQMRVRRKVSKQQEETIEQKFKEAGTRVAFYEGDQIVHSFYVWGDKDSGLTYLTRDEKGQAYIVEIPGYRSFLAGIYQLDKNGWRDPLVFTINWSNLSSVQVVYPDKEDLGFSVKYADRFYAIPEIQETDTTKLTDFLDNVSLLFVNDFLSKDEEKEYSEIINTGPQALFKIEDVGRNVYTLEVYGMLPGGKEVVGRIDSADYAVFDAEKVKKIMRPKSFFIKKETADIK
ncbi:DUF4340 domain-containing protein [Fulvivirga sp. 29W222]|uniref:DUF4340 domain-containing protein n=1 Tax=Fulvivirga marina TaxID=2494733 RepID=A0A937G0Z6_9BACT|nr:DUF4340 domain-containing protein [Fulvivirga marina]MBL6448642.1 DUF4340 domain-containing protein [Fulvivirga marina]